MPLICKGIICVELTMPRRDSRNSSFYSVSKWCKQCDRYIKFDGIRCPCCGAKLRTKSRNQKARLKRAVVVKRI